MNTLIKHSEKVRFRRAAKVARKIKDLQVRSKLEDIEDSKDILKS
jgi:hypothetical protein